jgi:hypothetical protein
MYEQILQSAAFDSEDRAEGVDEAPTVHEPIGFQRLPTDNTAQISPAIDMMSVFLGTYNANPHSAAGQPSWGDGLSEPLSDSSQVRSEAPAAPSSAGDFMHDETIEAALLSLEGLMSAKSQLHSSDLAQSFDWDFLGDPQLYSENLPQAGYTDSSSCIASPECAIVDFDFDTSLSDVSGHSSFN